MSFPITAKRVSPYTMENTDAT